MFLLRLELIACTLLLIQVLSVQSSSAISECPRQGVNSIRREAEQNELSFVFYYVSWSSAARQALLVFDGVANYFYEHAYFAAIDCWHLQCNCNRTHNVLYGSGVPNKWPTLIVRFGRQTVLQYNGDWIFMDVTRFIHNLIEPLDRVQNNQELKNLIRDSDAVVLALLKNADSIEYKQFVIAAIRWLENDPERNVRFAVAFEPDAQNLLKNDTTHSLPIMTLIDSFNNKNSIFNVWNTTEIVRWLRKSLKNMRQELNGYGTPMVLLLKAEKSPVLVLSVNPQPHDAHLLTLMSKYIGRKSWFDSKFAKCKQYWHNDYVDEFSSNTCIKTSQNLENISTHCYRKVDLNEQFFINYYQINEYLNQLWSHYFHITTNGKNNINSSIYLMALRERNICLTYPEIDAPALRIGILKYIRRKSRKLWSFTTESLRYTNRSLSVVLLDTKKHYDFLLQHDIHIDGQSAANVFIIDAKQEATYVMNESFSHRALLEFIKKYYLGDLPILQRSSSLPMPSSSNTQYIANYNRQLLLQALQIQNVTNVVLLYTPGCELSAVISQSFLQLSLLLHSDSIRFIRINTDTNDLPWELVMPTSPTLLVFPESDAMNSRIFPSNFKPDVRNLLGFILSQLEPVTQIRLALASCKRTRYVRRCLEFARSLVMQHIGQYLKYWEIYETERNQILEHLKLFNDFHIEIQGSFHL